MTETRMSDGGRAAFSMRPQAFEQVFGEDLRAAVAKQIGPVLGPWQGEALAEQPDAVLEQIEYLFTGWGCAQLTAPVLQRLPRLRAVFHGAGSVRPVVSPAFWERGLPITSAAEANSIATAEYALGCIILALKRAWPYQRLMRQRRVLCERQLPVPGGYGSKVGLVGFGRIGRIVRERLRPMDVRVLVHDPYVPTATLLAHGVEPRSLHELFAEAAVVSLHLPWVPATDGLIGTSLLESMPSGATFINTARGAIVNEAELCAVLARRPDLQAVLDVVYPEPPDPASPLFELDNVFLTPHIAGSMDAECLRLGQHALGEFRRFLAGEPLLHPVTRAQADRET